jgi:Peptidase M50B-like
VNATLPLLQLVVPTYHVPLPEVVGAGVIAGVLLVIRTVEYTTTVAHEGGHALLLAFFNVPIKGITLDSPGDGATGWEERLIGGDYVLVFMAGYLGPSGFGFLAAYLVYRDHPVTVLWLGLVLLGLFMILARNLRAFLAAVVLGVFVVAALRSHNLSIAAFTATTWAWILLAGSVIDVFGLQAVRRQARAAGTKDERSDAAKLAAHTGIPAPVWVLLFLVASFLALVYGGALLFGSPLAPPFHLPS